jgi:hypothetical protein
MGGFLRLRATRKHEPIPHGSLVLRKKDVRISATEAVVSRKGLCAGERYFEL